MIFIQISNNTIINRANSERELRSFYPDVCLQVDLNGCEYLTERGWVLVSETSIPEIDTLTQYITEGTPTFSNAVWQQTWVINQRSQEEIDVDSLQILEEQREQLWKAATSYEQKYISGSATAMLTVGVIQQKVKAIAVTSWIGSIWSEYYARKEALSVYSEPDLDFSNFGPMPYTVPELREEIGL